MHTTPAGLGQFPYSDADVAFMSGMIPHHAQAVIMARWARTHGARADVQVLCQRIEIAQTDEIHLMRTAERTISAYRDHGTTKSATGNLPV